MYGGFDCNIWVLYFYYIFPLLCYVRMYAFPIIANKKNFFLPPPSFLVSENNYAFFSTPMMLLYLSQPHADVRDIYIYVCMQFNAIVDGVECFSFFLFFTHVLFSWNAFNWSPEIASIFLRLSYIMSCNGVWFRFVVFGSIWGCTNVHK